jgi:Flp pilus assembly pilin Flp
MLRTNCNAPLSRPQRKRQRRGATAVQVAVVLGLVTLSAVVGLTQIGSLSSSQLSQTATDVGNPNSLVGRFGNSGSSSSSGSSSGSSTSGDSSSSGSSSSGGSTSAGDSGSNSGETSLCP